MNTDFDALIIGGGPAGAVAASRLAQAGWRVGLVEKTRFPRRKVCGEFISATTLPLLGQLGIGEAFDDLAGPEVRQIALFARRTTLVADMPRLADRHQPWGRALGREYLDTLLLQQAIQSHVAVWQPWCAVELRREGVGYCCRLLSKEQNRAQELRSRIVIAAHGSWEPGTLPTQPRRAALRGSDLLGFKAHFQRCRLPAGLMPLLAFPGGYGGMVQCDHGRTSLSCCIRRDQLERCRELAPQRNAAEAVLDHLRLSCAGVGEVLDGASLEDSWLSAGPIRPGIRSAGCGGVFLVGNAAGEAHPVIAEGISMAIQSAWLLCEQLRKPKDLLASPQALEEAHRNYRREWRRAFLFRIKASAVIAQWAMRPAAVACLQPLLQWFPRILTIAAHWCGKDRILHEPAAPECLFESNFPPPNTTSRQGGCRDSDMTS